MIVNPVCAPRRLAKATIVVIRGQIENSKETIIPALVKLWAEALEEVEHNLVGPYHPP